MSDDAEEAPRRARKRKAPDLSPGALSEAALRYLDRYDASVAQLRKVLCRRIQYNTPPDEAEAARREIEALLERLQASRLVDDARFAEGFVRGQRGRGASARKIRQKLAQRGIAAELVDEALSRGEEEVSEEEAARTFARKRRLARRHDLGDPTGRRKALAALARQGFSFDAAAKALAAVEEEDAGS